MVRVENFPVAFFGFLPLGFLPLTTPLPWAHHWLTLFHWFVPNGVQGRWIPTAITGSSTSLKPVKEASVKVKTGRTLSLSGQYFGRVFHKRELSIGKISFGSYTTVKQKRVRSLFFAGSFQILEILSSGNSIVLPGMERVSGPIAGSSTMEKTTHQGKCG